MFSLTGILSKEIDRGKMACWITDGSSVFRTNCKLIVAQVDCNVGGSHFNCIWKEGDGVSIGKHYWKIYFPTLDGGPAGTGAAIGLTSEDHLKRSYSLRGMMYNGSLNNGFNHRGWNFGPPPLEDDVFGILAVFEDDRLKMYIDVNGRSLGLAFDVPVSTFKSIFPVISFYKSGSATCTKQTDIPTAIDRVPQTFTGIEGNWKLVDMKMHCVNIDPISERKCKIRYDKKQRNYLWTVKVCNDIECRLSSYGKGYWKTTNQWQTLMGSTQMGVMKFESLMYSFVTEVKFVEIEPNGNLSVKSDTMSSQWTRYDDPGNGPFVGIL